MVPGAIEGNQGNLFADRMKDQALEESLSKEMKDRGMIWSIKGAQHISKAIELYSNGQLGKWCGSILSVAGKGRSNLPFATFQTHNTKAIPALESPHASRPWGKAIRNMTMNTHQLLSNRIRDKLND
jgi:hypothetical protein